MNRKTKRLTRRHITISDIAAPLIILLIALFYFSISRAGVQICDEATLISIGHRLQSGDRLIADDWSTAVLLGVFLELPVRLFCGITGSTEGIILFMRGLFIICHAAFSIIIYAVLRRYKWYAAAASAVYMCFLPLEMMLLSYNAISLAATVSICFLLFIPDAPGKFRLILSGFIFACSVLALPPLALLYFLYTAYIAALLIKDTAVKKGIKKQRPVFFTNEGWLFITAGIAICAAIFCISVFPTMTFYEISVSVPGIFEQVSSAANDPLNMERIKEIIKMFGVVPCAAALLIFAGTAADKNRKKRRLFWFGAALTDAIAAYAGLALSFSGMIGDQRNYLPAVLMRGIPLAFLGLQCYILSEKKNKKLFYSLMYCLFFSIIRDITSNIIFGLGAVGAGTAAFPLIKEFRDECAADIPRKAVKRAAAILCVAAVAVPLCAEALWKVEERSFTVIEDMFLNTAEEPAETIERGPLKGLHTTLKIKYIHKNMADDLDRASSVSEKNIYIAGPWQWCYMYLERPYTACSVMFKINDIETTQMRYWELHPDKRPDCIYIPFYDPETYISANEGADRIKHIFENYCTFKCETAKAGVILYDVRWLNVAA